MFGCLFSGSAFVFVIMVHFQVPGPTDERKALPTSSWSFPRWPAELLPISGLASLPGLRSLAGHTDWGLGTSLSPRTKEQLLEVISVFLDQLYFYQTGTLHLSTSKIWQHVEGYGNHILSTYHPSLCNNKIRRLSESFKCYKQPNSKYIKNYSKGTHVCNEDTVKETTINVFIETFQTRRSIDADM